MYGRLFVTIYADSLEELRSKLSTAENVVQKTFPNEEIEIARDEPVNMSDLTPEDREAIRKGEEDIAAGRSYSWDEVKERLAQRLDDYKSKKKVDDLEE